MPEFCFRRRLSVPIGDAVELLSDRLFKEGFDVMQESVDESSRRITITAFCTKIEKPRTGMPPMPYLLTDTVVGNPIPCVFVIETLSDGRVEVAVSDPLKELKPDRNSGLYRYVGSVREKLMSIIHSL